MSVFTATGGRYSEWPTDLFQFQVTEPLPPETPDDGDTLPDLDNDPIPEPEDN